MIAQCRAQSFAAVLPLAVLAASAIAAPLPQVTVAPLTNARIPMSTDFAYLIFESTVDEVTEAGNELASIIGDPIEVGEYAPISFSNVRLNQGTITGIPLAPNTSAVFGDPDNSDGNLDYGLAYFSPFIPFSTFLNEGTQFTLNSDNTPVSGVITGESFLPGTFDLFELTLDPSNPGSGSWSFSSNADGLLFSGTGSFTSMFVQNADVNLDGNVDLVDLDTIDANLGLELPDEDLTGGSASRDRQRREAGDLNLDQIVDQVDRDLALAQFGTAFANSETPLVSIDGDFNFDGVVNAADYTVWRDTLGLTGETLAADANGDESVTGLDYGIWRDNFGDDVFASNNVAATAVTASSFDAVPEPMASVIASGLILMGLFRRSGKR